MNIHRSIRTLQRLGLAAAVLVLSGCASVYLVDNQVQSFARWADQPGVKPGTPVTVPQAPQIYRFDRLPSQKEGRVSTGQDELENLTAQALAKVGWTLAAAGTASPWTVQVDANTLRLPRAPWDDPWGGYWGGYWGPGFGYGLPGRDYVVTGQGQVIWMPMYPRMMMESPYYQRELSLVIRHASSGKVVYETRAAHDGRWNSTPGLWSAMLDAALRDFPAPPEGVRQVNVEVPR
ncbi:hypothetical protein [Hydrogenophaga sp. BPS33]|uniref:hypothetical protein n=1 Tax=Hydrogenophaga sp. BPS33 TaxID=2651974 RepID=UPI00131F632D|nr:hypothetical protein [Hydrogenophaga sp. BPS33]QHE84203.1 hypothetical protein F9K07_04515 [Hydrogenophaga sp. BPS33]